MSDNIVLKPGDGALLPKPITTCSLYAHKKCFLISFEENMYQFCFLLIRFDVCHHHAADLWLLSKEMVWWVSVFWRWPATGRQKVTNNLFNFMQVASDGPNKCFGRCMRQGSNFPVPGEQGPWARLRHPLPLQGCLRGHHTYQGLAQPGPERLPFLVTCRTLSHPGALSPGTCCWRLCCSHGVCIGPCRDSFIH